MNEALLKRQSLWAWVTEDPPGEIGVLAGGAVGVGLFTLSGNTRARAERHRPVVDEIVRLSGKPARLVRFQYAETLTEVRMRE